jgi:uncharacterized protein YjbI with pentapeptide repeats
VIVVPPPGLAFATKLTSRLPPKPELLMLVKGVYSIVPDAPLVLRDRTDCAPTGDVFGEGDDDRAGACFYPSDFADMKLRAEVFVRGSFHAPGGRPVTESFVGFSIAGLSKRLRVVGRRAWADDALGSTASEPLPMTTVPVDWSHAYGGPGLAANTSGRGHTSLELPQIEAPDAPVQSRGDHNVPASFGPISPLWPERAKKVGTRYGKEWRETRAPFVAEDFDWTFHQAAPADQQLPGLLRGDETISFENMHPERSSLAVRLPGLRVRALARLATGFRLFALQLDTLVADLDAMTLTLVWRGHVAVREHDFADVQAILAVSEALGDPQTPQRELEARLEEIQRDPIGFEAARAEVMSKMIESYPRGEGAAPSALDPISARMKKELPPEFAAIADDVAIQMAEARKIPTADEDKRAEADAKLAEAVAASADSDEPPPPLTRKPGTVPSMGARRIVRQMMDDLTKEFDRVKVQEAELKPEERARLDRILQIPHDPSWPEFDPEYTVPEPLSADVPGPYANLIDRDFTGLDLSGLDLTGADLRGAVLTRARLVGTKLRGAKLRAAVLYKADAAGADFTGADLTRANCAKLRAVGADFTETELELAFFEDAVLEGAKLERARGEWSAFARANLTEVKARGCKLYRVDLEEAILRGADFTESSVRACVFSRADAEGIDLSGAEVRAISAEGVKLRGAKLVRAHGERMNLTGADLDGADLSLARVRRSHFIGASVRRCELWGADLAEARLSRADLSDSKLDRSNLIGADLSRARLDRTIFDGANLYDAKLIDAAGEGASFSGANLERCNYTTRRAEDA